MKCVTNHLVIHGEKDQPAKEFPMGSEIDLPEGHSLILSGAVSMKAMTDSGKPILVSGQETPEAPPLAGTDVPVEDDDGDISQQEEASPAPVRKRR